MMQADRNTVACHGGTVLLVILSSQLHNNVDHISLDQTPSANVSEDLLRRRWLITSIPVITQ